MKSDILSYIREHNNKTQSDFSRELGVSTRTIANWESSCTELPISISHLIKANYMEDILSPHLKSFVEIAFKQIPSELVDVWIIELRQSCILFPYGYRLAKVSNDKEEGKFSLKNQREVLSPTMLIPLKDKGLTSYPARTGKTVRLAGINILNDERKRHKHTRMGIHFADGVCRHLLHVPALVETGQGPCPVGVICFQNKIDLENGCLYPDEEDEGYTQEDENIAIKLAEQLFSKEYTGNDDCEVQSINEVLHKLDMIVGYD